LTTPHADSADASARIVRNRVSIFDYFHGFVVSFMMYVAAPGFQAGGQRGAGGTHSPCRGKYSPLRIIPAGRIDGADHQGAAHVGAKDAIDRARVVASAFHELLPMFSQPHAIDLDCPLPIPGGTLKFAEGFIVDPPVVVGNGKARIDPQRLVVVLDRPAVLATVAIGPPPVVVGRCEVLALSLTGVDHRRVAVDLQVQIDACVAAIPERPASSRSVTRRQGERTQCQHYNRRPAAYRIDHENYSYQGC
jgi:hypothetical protein